MHRCGHPEKITPARASGLTGPPGEPPFNQRLARLVDTGGHRPGARNRRGPRIGIRACAGPRTPEEEPQAEALGRIEQMNPARAAVTRSAAAARAVTLEARFAPWLPGLHVTFGLNGLNRPDGFHFHSHTWRA